MNILTDLNLTFKGIKLYKSSFKKNPFLSKDEILDFQYKQLKKLLIESGKNVPYYRSLFNELSFNPDQDFKQIEDLKILPILKKKTVRDNPKSFHNESIKNYMTLFTSGSTGNPLEVRVSFNAWVVEQAVVWRHWKWSGYNFRDKMAIVRSFVPKNEILTKKEFFRNFTYYSPFHINHENAQLYLKQMISEKTKFLRGYPSSIRSLADIVLKHNLKIPQLKAVLVASERLSNSDREIIEKAFKCSVFNHYGLADISVMMGDCGNNEGLHNYEDYGYLELIEDYKLGENIRGIVGTNLHNTAMPLIRYDTGDLAELAEKSCSCNRIFPTIKNIIGRKDSVIKTIEGFEVPTVNFYTMLEYYTNIKQWQIIQKSLTSIEVNISADGNISDLELQIIKGFKERLSNSMKIQINWNASFVQKNEGKIPTFISQI